MSPPAGLNRNSAVSSSNIPRARRIASADGVTFFPEAVWKIPPAGEGEGEGSANLKPPKPPAGESSGWTPAPDSNVNPPAPDLGLGFMVTSAAAPSPASFLSPSPTGHATGDNPPRTGVGIESSSPASFAKREAAAIFGRVPRVDIGACNSLSSWMYRLGAGVTVLTPAALGVVAETPPRGVVAETPPRLLLAPGLYPVLNPPGGTGVLLNVAGLGYMKLLSAPPR